jgi:HlyD family secretion protein
LKKKLILSVFLGLLLGAGGLVYWGQERERSAELYYSGTIEATRANLSFQVNGRVKEVLVDEGHAVQKGQTLAVLGLEEFLARRDQSRANLAQAEKNLHQLETVVELNRNMLPAEVERAEAGVEALEAQLSEARAGYRSQDVERARLAVEETRAAMTEARKDKARYDDLFQRRVVPEKNKDAADLKYETAVAEHERAKEAYHMMREGYRKEDIDLARSRLAEGRAALKLARINLKKIETAEKEVEAARARLDAAKAALDLAEIQISYTELKAPFGGIIVSRNVEPGEVVSPGQEVISIADLSKVDLKVFVGETDIGRIKPGQEVEVKIDTFPNKIYKGRVSFISPEGEFTPKIIQTHKERVKLVYLVKIAIPNPDMELKSGMPADAWFR